MKAIKIIYLTVIICASVNGFAQKTEALALNTHVPNFKIGNVLNSNSDAGNIDDYKGKVVILDFWHTTCSSCITGFSKMTALQKKFGDSIKIFLVTKNTDAEVNKLFKRLDINLPDLTVITNDTLLERLFPYKALPNHIWIEQNGQFISSTFDYNTNEKNLSKLLSKQKIMISRKQDNLFNPHESVIKQTSGVISKYIVAYSVLMKGFYEYAPYGGIDIRSNSFGNPFSFRAVGLTPLQLLHCAFFGELYGYNPGVQGITDMRRIVLETRDNKALFEPKDPTLIDDWKANNFFGYEVLMEPQNKLSLYKRMQEDLSGQLQYLGTIVLRKREYMALVRVGEPSKLKTEGIGKTMIENGFFHYRNVSMTDIIRSMNQDGTLSNLPIIDETSIGYKVDLDLPTKALFNIDEMNQQLKLYGLLLVKKTGRIPMLVIKDKKTTATNL